MVGDSLDNDVEAARSAGWRGIWLRRDCSGGSAADEIADLSGLPVLLGA
jgi:FMN phosphatase YigB (HAD superfamily)